MTFMNNRDGQDRGYGFILGSMGSCYRAMSKGKVATGLCVLKATLRLKLLFSGQERSHEACCEAIAGVQLREEAWTRTGSEGRISTEWHDLRYSASACG